MFKVLVGLLATLIMTSCLNEHEVKEASVSTSDMPDLEISCAGSSASDCMGVVGVSGGAATGKKVKVVWMQDTNCTDRGTSEAHTATSSGVSENSGGNVVQYMSSFTYSSGETEINYGNYA